jgi:CBS domain-containing protein
MTPTIREVMTKDPVCMPADTTVLDAARTMRDRDIGDVIMLEGNRIAGIVTDRDIVVRALAEGRNPGTTTIGEVATQDVTTISPDDGFDAAVKLMRERNIRRLPVVENGKPAGIVSLGDLAMERDSKSVLADISAAPPNH